MSTHVSQRVSNCPSSISLYPKVIIVQVTAVIFMQTSYTELLYSIELSRSAIVDRNMALTAVAGAIAPLMVAAVA